LLALPEDSDDRIHAFGKSWKKNPRSMPSHDPLLLDRTEDEDVDVDVAMVVEDLLQKNANTASTTNFVSIVANPDILLSVKTYYCLRQAVGNDLIFEVKVIDPKDEQGDIQEEDSEVKA